MSNEWKPIDTAPKLNFLSGGSEVEEPPTALEEAQDRIEVLESALNYARGVAEQMRVDRDEARDLARKWRAEADALLRAALKPQTVGRMDD